MLLQYTLNSLTIECFVMCRCELTAGQERQEGLSTKLSSLEQAQAAAAAVEPEAAAGLTSSLLDVLLKGQVSSVPLAVVHQRMAVHCVLLVMGQIMCYSQWIHSQCTLSAVHICVLHTLCTLEQFVMHSLHGGAASNHTDQLSSLCVSSCRMFLWHSLAV